MATQLSISEIARSVSGVVEGDGALMVHGVAALAEAQSGELTFIRDNAHIAAWVSCKAAAAIVGPEVLSAPGLARAFVRVKDADIAVAIVLELFALPPAKAFSGAPGVHPAAVVEPTATLGAGVSIGPHAYIGAGVTIGDRTVIHANVSILENSRVGKDCTLYPSVVIRERCTLGDRVILHPNVSIGADGFGYRAAPGGRGIVKIPQLGTVRIGNDVEIGSNSCVDRAKFAATVVGDGTKIDNLCQVGHNCVIGRFCIIAGKAGLSGSVVVGDGVIIGGGCVIKDHITIGAGAKLAGASAVMIDVPPGATWGGYPAQDLRDAFRELSAVRKLPDMMRSLKKKSE